MSLSELCTVEGYHVHALLEFGLILHPQLFPRVGVPGVREILVGSSAGQGSGGINHALGAESNWWMGCGWVNGCPEWGALAPGNSCAPLGWRS
ncbi:hypothetical protein CEXT_671561 [Caerostris extrusa]|uniref:Uncharacterized protein n=1 Tax=Caerostris extrusa TaxID=172846 RepID=A0AAV4TAH9_CAEEX|nr:hypothetical protein CEXT_671561 [Caerostris extrusa]